MCFLFFFVSFSFLLLGSLTDMFGTVIVHFNES